MFTLTQRQSLLGDGHLKRKKFTTEDTDAIFRLSDESNSKLLAQVQASVYYNNM
jgi:hypothetical protein